MAIVSRANSPPNGIGFKPSRGNPTGRFTNGRTIADIVGEKLGQPNYAVPYLAPNASGDVLLNGVNCALCSGGIHSAAGSVFSMDLLKHPALTLDYWAHLAKKRKYV
ncbi:GDSL esterase/lipase At3g50400 [Brassica rapa]|uniref:GDSL esterase/lipase At3g50400 n=1 Tax=Brassica campestris TaxID=3711 RepID=UPI0004F1A4E4|nr:GDSL esterase/lipase At3g50400 [Brassica rapa]